MFWKAWAPRKIKMISWLLHQNRLLCNDRLQRRGWPNGYFCDLCLCNLETSFQLFWECGLACTSRVRRPNARLRRLEAGTVGSCPQHYCGGEINHQRNDK
ncbi:hypothetical protein VPH35_090158 [Triticum aestivum]